MKTEIDIEPKAAVLRDPSVVLEAKPSGGNDREQIAPQRKTVTAAGREAMDGAYTATFDRIVDGETAIMVLDADGDVFERSDVPVDRLPVDCDADSIFAVTVGADEIVEMPPRPAGTDTPARTESGAVRSALETARGRGRRGS